MQHNTRNGLSLVGLLVTLVCILVLSAVLMTAVNKATTGQGSSVKGTVDSVTDQMNLNGMYQSMFASTIDNNGRYLVPSKIVGDRDVSHDTTANFYSAMIAKNYFRPKQLISAPTSGSMMITARWPTARSVACTGMRTSRRTWTISPTCRSPTCRSLANASIAIGKARAR